MTIEAIIVWVLVGLVAGFIASRFVGGSGLIRYIVAGLLGSVVGGFLFAYFGVAVPIDNAILRELVISVIGAVIVIVVARLIV